MVAASSAEKLVKGGMGSSAAALALQRLALHRRPSDDIADVNGVAARPLAIVLVVVISLVLAPVIFLLLWSGGFSVAKLGISHAEPMSFLSLRYACVCALLAPLRSPARVTVKVKGVLPDCPSRLLALVAAIDSDASSLRMRPLAEAVPIMA